ncbi:MAG: FAD-dependent oxidoreductase [Clostridiales bacterium]|nr:FAD-dependent oxidoreductase [Clostridiales bacterium]
MYDVVIIGAGMSGLTAAIYCARAGVSFIVLEQDGWGGGQITSAHHVENYPAVSAVTGAYLGEALRHQALDLGCKIEQGIVSRVVDFGEYKKIILHSGMEIKTHVVIAATGAQPKKLGVPGEERLLGRGVSYCAVCDGAFFAKKGAFVIGGGDTAVEDAIYLADICQNVTVVHRRQGFRAAKSRVAHLKTLKNVNIRTGETLSSITGEDMVDGVELSCGGKMRHFDAQCVFIAVGSEPQTGYLADLPLELDAGYIVAGESCKTAVPGIYAAGDIRKKELRQAVTAAADGANAAFSALQFLQEQRNA